MNAMPDELTGAVIMATWALLTIEYLHPSPWYVAIRNRFLSGIVCEKVFRITHIYNYQYEKGRWLVQSMLSLSPDLAEINNKTLINMDLPGFDIEIGASAATCNRAGRQLK